MNTPAPKNLPALISEIAEVGEKAEKYCAKAFGNTPRHNPMLEPYATAFNAGAASQAPIRLALLEAVGKMEKIAENYVSEGDCESCEFGPLQSDTHQPECVYRIVRESLQRCAEILEAK